MARNQQYKRRFNIFYTKTYSAKAAVYYIIIFPFLAAILDAMLNI